jgi:dTDP-4-amino-4,6-dideoxygalactose transaminase
MRVPLLDLGRQNLPLQAELAAAFRRVLESGHFILGPEVERFEAAAAEIAGARFGIGMSSGTDAILAALMTLEVGPGDEVICPSFTFFATAGCVARLGAKPVFADSRPECFNIDPATIEPLITPRTRAIIAVHLFGQSADIEPVLEIARRHDLPLIEDAAQSFGASYRGRPTGSFGRFGTISFFPTKNLGALGDAGLLMTNDADLAEKARRLRNHGMNPKYFHRIVGGNFRLDALQAALLFEKLPYLEQYTAKRQQHACAYTDALRLLPHSEAVELVAPVTRPDRTHIANQYTIRVRRGPRWQREDSPREALRQWLAGHGIATEIYYPVPLHAQECFRSFGPYPPLPVAEQAAREVLSLPVFPELTAEEQASVIDAIAQFMAGADRP